MKAGRLFLLLTTISLIGAALVRPGGVLPLATRFISPLFAQQADSTDTSAHTLPDYVAGDSNLSSTAGAAPSPSSAQAVTSAPAVPAKVEESEGGVTLLRAPTPPPALLTTTAAAPAVDAAAPPPVAEPATPAGAAPKVDAAPNVETALQTPAQLPGPDGGTEPDAVPRGPSVITKIEPIDPAPGSAGPAAAPQRQLIAAKTLFGAAKAPAPLAARSIGSYARGCLSGAVALPVDGPAWQAMRLSRNRNWGHPKLVALVERLAGDAQKLDSWPGLLVGDISQPRGGPMLTGHASHQIGLDADIWLTPMPDRRLSNKEREEINATSMLDSTDLAVDPKIFTDKHVSLIKRAASYPEVERVLVHPAIKKALCKAAGTDRRWLGKVRPIGGHYYHFHIRMACPPGMGSCTPQKPPTGDDGCTKEVDEWLARLAPSKTPEPPKPPGYKPPPPKPPITMAQLPQECTAVLESGPEGVAVPAEAKVDIRLTVRAPAALKSHLRRLRAAEKK